MSGNVSGAGTVQINSGTVNLNGGTYNITGATQTGGGTANFNSGVNLVSLGPDLSVTGGVLNLSSGEAVSETTLTLSSGNFTGTDNVTVSGATTWTGGSLTGSGQLTTNGSLAITGSITNNGSITVQGSGALSLGAPGINSTSTQLHIESSTSGTARSHADYRSRPRSGGCRRHRKPHGELRFVAEKSGRGHAGNLLCRSRECATRMLCASLPVGVGQAREQHRDHGDSLQTWDMRIRPASLAGGEAYWGGGDESQQHAP